MKGYKYSIAVIGIMMMIQACDSKSENKNEEKVDTPAVVIDSSAFKVKKTEIKDFKIVEDIELSSQAEVEKLVQYESTSEFDTYQKFAQDFIVACATKNYVSAGKFLAYTGTDKSRVGKDFFNFENADEKAVVKTTVDVVYNFLAESSEYRFISSKAGKNKKGEDVQIVEITFFKKGMGMNRRFFEVIDIDSLMLISNMR